MVKDTLIAGKLFGKCIGDVTCVSISQVYWGYCCKAVAGDIL
jgi:hypothetical protein